MGEAKYEVLRDLFVKYIASHFDEADTAVGGIAFTNKEQRVLNALYKKAVHTYTTKEL